MRGRDSQRSKLYAAERNFWRAIGDKQFPDRLGYLMFIERIERDRWFRRKYGARTFNVRDGRGARRGRAWGSRSLSLPRFARTPAYILHEVAHLATNTHHGFGSTAHGWEFASVMLDLVGHFLGRDAKRILRDCYRQGKVRYKKPRAGRVLTELERQVLRDRLATYRLARASGPGGT